MYPFFIFIAHLPDDFMKHILIIEDDTTFAAILARYLERYEYTTVKVGTIRSAREVLEPNAKEIDLILLDYNLPDGTGMEILEFLKEKSIIIPVLIMTGFLDIKTAVGAIKKGATDYITKPINQEELLMQIGEVLRPTVTEQTIPEALKVTPASGRHSGHNYVAGKSVAAQELARYIELVAATDMTVLIVGESGTGKENVARLLHMKSERAHKPFVAIDCGALSNELASSELFGHVKGAFTGALLDKKGQLEIADGGTIFLDEVGNLSYENQMKLLRVLQEKEMMRVGDHTPIKIDVRVVTATNEDFQQAISKGTFREDLYHRLNEFKIRIPSLAQRKDDLDDFIDFFIHQSNEQLRKHVRGIDEAVRKIFFSYQWPGNIRELQNVVRRAVLLAAGNLITTADLPEDMEMVIGAVPSVVASVQDIKSINEQFEKELIIKTLIQTRYNKSKAARMLKIDRTTLYNKLNKYGILDEDNEA